MRKIISESLVYNEQNFLHYEAPTNQAFSIEVEDTDITSKEDEEEAAKTFSWSPPIKVVTVKSVKANIIDDVNTDINIEMSNGDSIVYDLYETRTPRSGQTAPPYYSFSLKINGKVIPADLDEILGNTGTIIGDILLFYKQTVLEKKKK